jgi:hypothetical protein
MLTHGGSVDRRNRLSHSDWVFIAIGAASGRIQNTNVDAARLEARATMYL